MGKTALRTLIAATLAVLVASTAHANDPLAEVLSQSGRDLWDSSYDVSVVTPDAARSVATTQPIFSQRTLAATERAIFDYRAIVAAGGWPIVPSSQKLRLGANGPAVVALRRRLMASGDLSTRAGQSSQFDTYVDRAVKRFQSRHGLPADGVLGSYSYAAMNVSASVRLRQLEINAERLRRQDMPAGRFVMVNIPGAEIEAVENGRVGQRHTAIVGRISRPTPILSSQITELNLNPYWNAPKSIVRRDIIPLMRKNPAYLQENGIRIYGPDKQELDPRSIDWTTEEAVDYHFKQDPSKINAMRAAKINFRNKHAVYMHDTPEQGLFDKLVRFESSGCVRVKNIRDLLTWIAKDTPQWSRRSLERTIAAGERTDAQLAAPVGVHFTYVTAWSTAPGVVQFRDDIYKRDREPELSLGTTG